MEEVVLQIWKAASGQFGGRIRRGDAEDGRVAGCASKDDVEAQAIEGLRSKINDKLAGFLYP